MMLFLITSSTFLHPLTIVSGASELGSLSEGVGNTGGVSEEVSHSYADEDTTLQEETFPELITGGSDTLGGTDPSELTTQATDTSVKNKGDPTNPSTSTPDELKPQMTLVGKGGNNTSTVSSEEVLTSYENGDILDYSVINDYIYKGNTYVVGKEPLLKYNEEGTCWDNCPNNYFTLDINLSGRSEPGKPGISGDYGSATGGSGVGGGIRISNTPTFHTIFDNYEQKKEFNWEFTIELNRTDLVEKLTAYEIYQVGKDGREDLLYTLEGELSTEGRNSKITYKHTVQGTDLTVEGNQATYLVAKPKPFSEHYSGSLEMSADSNITEITIVDNKDYCLVDEKCNFTIDTDASKYVPVGPPGPDGVGFIETHDVNKLLLNINKSQYDAIKSTSEEVGPYHRVTGLYDIIVSGYDNGDKYKEDTVTEDKLLSLLILKGNEQERVPYSTLQGNKQSVKKHIITSIEEKIHVPNMTNYYLSKVDEKKSHAESNEYKVVPFTDKKEFELVKDLITHKGKKYDQTTAVNYAGHNVINVYDDVYRITKKWENRFGETIEPLVDEIVMEIQDYNTQEVIDEVKLNKGNNWETVVNLPSIDLELLTSDLTEYESILDRLEDISENFFKYRKQYDFVEKDTGNYRIESIVSNLGVDSVTGERNIYVRNKYDNRPSKLYLYKAEGDNPPEQHYAPFKPELNRMLVPETLTTPGNNGDMPQMLEGAVFEVYHNGLKLGEYTTNWDGEIELELELGEYTLIEIKAPEGYEMAEDEFNRQVTFTVDDKTAGVWVLFQNKKAEETITLDVTKTWKNDDETQRPSKVTVSLYADGEYDSEYVLVDEEDWKLTLTDLPKYNSLGEEIKYTLKEESVLGYTSEVTYSDTEIIIVNTKEIPQTPLEPATVKLSIEKQWKLYEKSTQEVVVDIHADGVLVRTVKLNEGNNWKVDITDLPVQESVTSKEPIKYEITERVIDGFKSEITGTVKDGFVVVNTEVVPMVPMEPATTSVKVEKQWKLLEKEKQEVTINLLGDGKVVDTVKLNEGNDWKHEFTGLLVQESVASEKGIEYTVEELPLDGFQVEITGTATEGYVIVNTEVVPPKVCDAFTVVGDETTAGAIVTIEGPTGKVETGTITNGKYVGKPLEVGKEYTVTVSKDGYITSTVKVTGSNDNCELSVKDLELQPKVCDAFTVTVHYTSASSVSIYQSGKEISTQQLSTDGKAVFAPLKDGEEYELVVYDGTAKELYRETVEGTSDVCELLLEEPQVCDAFTVTVHHTEGSIVELYLDGKLVDRQSVTTGKVIFAPLTQGGKYEIVLLGQDGKELLRVPHHHNGVECSMELVGEPTIPVETPPVDKGNDVVVEVPATPTPIEVPAKDLPQMNTITATLPFILGLLLLMVGYRMKRKTTN